MPLFLNLLFLLLISCVSHAKVVVLATFPIPLYVESVNEGLFVSLTREVASRSGENVKILVQPTGKALISFSNQKVLGFFPAFEPLVPKGTINTTPYHKKIDYIFYRKAQPHKNLSDLVGLKVGLNFRNYYVKELLGNKKIKFEYSDDHVANMKRLARGELDAVISEERAGTKALELGGVRDIEFDKAKPVSEQAVYYSFQNTPEGRRVAERFSAAIESMKKDGSLDRLLGQVQQ